MSSKILSALEARKKRKEEEEKNLSVESALKERKSRIETDLGSTLSSLQEGLTKEVEAYKGLGNLSFGTDMKGVLDSTNESRVNLEDLKRKTEAYRKQIGEDKADEILSYIDQLQSGYNSYLSNAELFSSFKTEDEYKQWVSDNEAYEKKKTLDLDAAQKEIDDLQAQKTQNDKVKANRENLYGTLVSGWMRSGYSKEEAEKKALGDSRIVKYDEQLSNYDSLSKELSEKKLIRNQAERIQEGIRLSGVADSESEFYDPEFEFFDDYNGASPEKWHDSKDNLYEYVNNYNGFRSKYKDHYRTMSSDNPFSDGVSSYEEKAYDFLNEQEIAIFNYYYAKDGKKAAEKYLDSIQDTLYHRKANERFKDFEGNTIQELLFGINAGVDQFKTGIENLFNPDDYISVNDTQLLSQKVREDLSDDSFKFWYNFKTGEWEDHVFGNSLGQVAYDINTTTSNMLPSIIVGAATGSVAGTVLLGASAAGNAYQEMLNFGYDKGQARFYSALVGASEASLEYLLGGISSLGGKATGGVVTKLLSKVDNALGRAAIRFGGSMLSEGVEEGLQEYLEPWFKTIAFKTDYEAANLDEILYSGLLGALSAFGLEGGGIAISEFSTYQKGKNLKTYGEVDRLVKLGKTFSADSVAAQIANRVNKDTGAYTIGRLFNEVGAALSEKNITDITNALVERGIDPKHAKILVEGLENTVNGVELTKRQQDALEKNPVLADVWNDVIINPNSTIMQRTMEYGSIANKSATSVSKTYGDTEVVKALIDEGLSSPDGSQSKTLATKYSKILESGKELSNSQIQKLVDANKEQIYTEEQVEKASEKAKETIANSNLTVSEDGRTINTKTGKNIKVKEISSIKDGEMILRTEDGKTVNAKDVSFSDSDAIIYSAVLDMGLNAASANAIIRNFDTSEGLTAEQYALGVQEAYKYGRYGYHVSEMSLNGFSADLSVAQKSLAYRLGAYDAKNIAKAAQSKITEAIEARKKSGVEKAEAVGKLRFADGKKAMLETMSADQKAVVDFFGDLAVVKPAGITLRSRYDANGSFNLGTNEITISLDSNASSNPVAALLFTAGHESGHEIKKSNPEGFKRLGEFLAKEYGKKGESVHARVLEMQKKSKNNLTYDEAHEEWVCQSLQRMFASVINNKDSGVLQRLKQFDNKVAQLLYKALSKLASKISSLLEKLTPGTFEERFVAEMDAATRKLFEAMYAEELVTALDNAQWLSGVDVMNDILGNNSIEVGKTSLQEMNRRQTRFQEKTEFEAQPKEIITVGTDAKKPKANRKTLGGRNKVTIAGKTFKGDVSVKELRDARFVENGFSKEEIDKHNEFIQHMAEMMEEARVKYRFIGLDDIYNAKILISPTSGEITISALVNNGDYPINFDFTKVCKKRVALQQIVEQLAREKGKKNTDGSVTEVNLSPENIKAINDILAEAGIETACLCCFVESKRYNIQSLIQENVIDVWNALVDEIDPNAGYFNFADESVNESKIPDKEFDSLYEQVIAWRKQKGKSSIPEEKMQQFLETTPAARKKLRFADLVTEKGRTNLHKLYPDIESLIGSKLGTSAPKSIEAFAPYNGEIDLMEATGETGLSEYLFSIAGARSQSFSDFMIAHIFDVVQKTASLSARKLPAHVYTKEIARARLFGMTGEKHNMSVLFNIDPEVDSWNAGLKEDGSYFLSDYNAYKSGESQYIQSIGWNDAVNLQNTEGYSKDCGIIGVGFSYNNMIKLHNDPEVRQVIGYHTSSLAAVVKPLTHLDKATDYTPVQNTLTFVGFVKPMYAIPEGVPSYATPPQDVKPTKGTAKTQKVNDTFDIKATFEKLANGKKGEARTQAAKETLRQLLEYAESNGLALATQKAEAGHGEFDLYSDVANTKNPYISADHYIEYCIERGYLPAFFEFSMNQNYYKDIFDWNPFDRLSYNPETGLHEDSDGRQAYAPQTAVHMLNEDGSYAFPSDFFEIVDKQMKNYDEYSQMVESKMPDVMKSITSIDGMTSNLKFQFRMETDSKIISEAENLEKRGASRKYIWDKHGVIRDAGGHWVSEFSDNLARIYPRCNATGKTATGTIRLKNIFKHIELYTRFPEAAEIVIDLESGPFVARYNRKTNTISINKDYLNNLYELKVALLHEIQHFIQQQDGRPRGASIKYYESLGMSREEAKQAYIYTAGEIEASMTAARMDSDDSKRRSEMPDYQWSKAKVRYQEKNLAPTFYSQMGKVVEGVKQDKLAANSVVNMLRGKGVKAEEIRWSGIVPFLEGKKSVTKQELLDFINGSMLRIDEQMSSNDIDLRYDSSKHAYIHYDAKGNVIDTYTYSEFLDGYVSEASEEIYSNPYELQDALREEYGKMSSPRWAEYKLDGGENYREIVFTMPNSSYSNQMMRTHWGNEAEGVLVHARIQDFDVNGKRMLFVEEIQSDWHNEGHKHGYESDITADEREEFTKLEKTIDDLNKQRETLNKEKGTLDIDYFKGEKMSFDEYSNKSLALIDRLDKTTAKLNRSINKREKIFSKLKNAAPDAPFKDTYHEYVLKRLLRMAAEEGYDSIGWTPADIQSDRWSDEYAEGYRIEYDQDIPKFLKKYGRQWVAKVGTTKLKNGTEVWSMDITDSMKDSVLHDGQVMYQERDYEGNTLSESQQEFFKNSKVRWGERLMPVYHGTRREFTVFDSMQGYDENRAGGLLWAAKDYEYAKDYSYSDEPIVMKGYLNITKMLDIGDIDSYTNYESRLQELADAVKLTPEELESMVDYKRILIYDITSSKPFRDRIVELGYDGVVAWESGLQTFGFVDSNQFKDTTNKNPTSDPDIRYQERSTEDISNRGLLANALESAATTGEEKNLLRNYKTNIRLIEAEQKKLSEIMDKLFAKGSKIKPEERKKLQSEMKQTSTRINSYDRQLLNLESMQPIKKVLAREKEQAKKRQKQKDKEIFEAYKDKTKAAVQELIDKNREDRKKAIEFRNNTVKELMKKNQESRQKAAERRDKTQMRHKIKGVVNELNQLLLKGTKDKHVMIGLQKAVASALDAVNMDTVGAEERVAKYNALIAKAKDPDVIASLTATRDRIAEQGDSMNERLTALKDAYSKIKNSDDPLIANSHDEVIENKIESVVNSIGNTPIREMTLEQLEDVYDLYKMVLTTIRNSNKAFKLEKAESISSLGNNIMGEIYSIAGEKQYTPKAMEWLKKFGWSSLKPTQAFETIGSGTFKKVFENVRAGEDTWAVDVSEARDYYREKSSKYGYDSWDLEQRYEFTSKSGKKFRLSLEQIMSLYAYSKRKQADLHLDQGGFVFDESIEVVEKKKGIPVKYKVNTATAYSISKEELGNIISTLSDGQKNFVDEMQAYLSDVMGAKGNEVSLEMYGVKLFKEQFYFPLKSAKQFMFEQNEVAGEVRIKNSGFSKETVAKANNPIILSNFMDVWSKHVNDMSMYHSFVLPLEDFNRVFNYKTPTSDTMNPESVKSYLQNAYGTQPVEYIKQLITDLNGGARVDASADLVNKGLSLFKKGAVFASASVVIQQPSAIARAFAYINPKYFVTAKNDITKHSRDWEECKQYAPVARIKEMGYFDTNVGPQTTEWITAKEYKGFKEKTKALFTDSNYRDEILSKAPALADELAWTHIWNAVKKEIASTTNLKVGSEEFLKRAGERFTDVIVNTQVYDSVLTRSGLMRSKDTGVKMATAFMAEPTTSLNMIVNAFVQGKRGNKKFAKNIVGGVAASIILNSILVSLVYAARDDDEDETYVEKYLGSLTSELLDGFNPITYIPFAKDFWSIAQGYNVERSDMSVVSKLWESFEELFDEEKSVEEKVHDFAGSVANLFGLPLKNIIRDAGAVLNLATNDLKFSDTTIAGVGYSAADALRNSVPLLGRFYKEDTKVQKLYDAILGGNATEISRAKAGFKDQKAIDNAIRKALRENDPRINEAAQARIDGDMTLYKKKVLEIKAEGYFSQDNIVGAINSEINELTKTESSGTSKSVPLYTTADYYKAAANGDYADVEAVKEYLIQSGKTEAQIESSINSYVKDAYEKGEIGESKAVSLMVSFGGKDEDEANIAIKYVDFKKEYPEYEDIITEAKYAKYYEPMSDYHNRSIESSGISISVYAKYCELSAECTGTDKDGDGKTDSGSKKAEILRVIHKLPINSYQKDALYYLNGWSEKTLYEAPWH